MNPHDEDDLYEELEHRVSQRTAQLTTIGVQDVVIEVEFHLPHRIISQETIKSVS